MRESGAKEIDQEDSGGGEGVFQRLNTLFCSTSVRYFSNY
jgi:hypothetical protein